MAGESGVIPSIIDELASLDIQGDQLEGGRGVIGSMIDEFHCSDIQGDQTQRES